MASRSYEIGYRFQRRVKEHMTKLGWNVIIQPKSAFPDMICWRPIMISEALLFEINAIECKVNKYLNPDEKTKTKEIFLKNRCNRFIVAYRKTKKLLFYEYKLVNGELVYNDMQNL